MNTLITRAQSLPARNNVRAIIAQQLRQGPANAPIVERTEGWITRILAICFILLPTAVAIIYFCMVAADMYVSDAVVLIRNNETQSNSLLDSFIGKTMGTSGSSQDSHMVIEYMLSQEMAEAADQALGTRAHYSRLEADSFSRLRLNATKEQYLKFWRTVVSAEFDNESGGIVLKIRAFTPEFAQDLGKFVIERSEELVNTISTRSKADTVSFAEEQVKVAEGRLLRAADAVTRFRKSEREVDPAASAGKAVAMIGELEGNLAGARTQLAEATTFLRPDAAKVKQLEARVRMLQKQIELQRERLGSLNNQSISDNLGEYENLRLEQEFGQKAYQTALASLEMARAEALRKTVYLVAFVPPSLPDEAIYPKRLKGIGVVFLGSALLLGILALLLAVVREHSVV